MYNCNYLIFTYNHDFISQLFPKLHDFNMYIFLMKYMNLSVCLYRW